LFSAPWVLFLRVPLQSHCWGPNNFKADEALPHHMLVRHPEFWNLVLKLRMQTQTAFWVLLQLKCILKSFWASTLNPVKSSLNERAKGTVRPGKFKCSDEQSTSRTWLGEHKHLPQPIYSPDIYYDIHFFKKKRSWVEMWSTSQLFPNECRERLSSWACISFHVKL
jgi:hypothetical protein